MILDMPLKWTQARGRDARRAILEELRRRADAGEHGPSSRDLAALLGLAQGSVTYHLRTLKAAGLIRSGDGYELTDAGAIATD